MNFSNVTNVFQTLESVNKALRVIIAAVNKTSEKGVTLRHLYPLLFLGK